MTIPRNYLFNDGRLFDVLESMVRGVTGRVQSVSEAVIRARSDQDLEDQLLEDLKVAPLSLDLDARTMERQEVQVDVTDDPRRMGYHDGRKIIVPGIRVVITIPFEGDPELWRYQPSTYRMSSPIGRVEIDRSREGGLLHLPFEQPADQPSENIKRDYERRLDDINFAIEHQKSDLAGFERRLRGAIQAELRARRDRLTKHDGLSELLGIPETDTLQDPSISEKPSRSSQKEVEGKDRRDEADMWDVFISHASEDKESFVRALAEALEKKGVRIWYDEATLRVGDSLRRSIDRGLANSNFGVVVLSEAFFSKDWPQRELDGLVALEEAGRKVVLPIWHGVDEEGVRRFSPTLADRLAVTSDKGISAVVEELIRVIRD